MLLLLLLLLYWLLAEISCVIKVVEMRFEKVVVCLAESNVERVDSTMADVSFVKVGDCLEEFLHDVENENLIEGLVVC